jgi:RimJ/RimL family protein N-acetyltransferase
MDPQPLPVELVIPHGGSSLRCRLPGLDDIPAVVEACQDPEIPRWTTVPSPYGEAEARRYVEFCAARWGTRSGLHLLIIPGPDHPLVDLPLLGTVGFDVDDWADEQASVGYWIHADARGHGVASTATAGVCRWLLEAGMKRIQAEALVGNTGSAKTLDKVGFLLEGTHRGVAAGPCGVGADRIDVHRFGLLPEDYSRPG